MCTVGYSCATVYVMQFSALTHSYQPSGFSAVLLGISVVRFRRHTGAGNRTCCTELRVCITDSLSCVASYFRVAFEVANSHNAIGRKPLRIRIVGEF